ncbi:CobD/CbiB family protein [Limnohabitans sp.]|uniref:CobD/CbiB family protein n=1 Tax=Limnohabitans sp. TaxID=1907725 RepID=UPI00286EEF94|nr:CobD/CbiB family protein [Limnohabitans sp.]
MSFLSLLLALLIEQARPLVRGNWVHRTVRAWTLWISRTLDAGHPRLAWSTWSLAVGVPVVIAAVLHWVLMAVFGWPVAMVWSIAVLYVTLGFRQFSHHFTDIRDALDVGDERLARELLAEWQHVEVGSLPRSELLRHVIEHSVLSAHHHVFGVLAWFSILAALGFGPAGAVIYCMSEMVSRAWQSSPKASKGWVSDALQNAACDAWHRLDWLSARLTAVAFAVVGNFEEAIDCWRHHAQRFPDDNDGVVLAATAGALNVRLGGEALRAQSDDETQDSESTPGRTPEMAHLSSVVGLVWRSVVLWMVLLALLTLARLLG